MDFRNLLDDAFTRVLDDLDGVLDGLDADGLLWQPDPGANSIGWLAWHIGRCEDLQMAALAGADQVWTQQGWNTRFALPYSDNDLGYGHTPEQVRAFAAGDPELLGGYYRAVHERTVSIIAGCTADSLERIVDDRWDPPVSEGVRLVSILNDVTQHVGQAAYLRGLVSRRG